MPRRLILAPAAVLVLVIAVAVGVLVPKFIGHRSAATEPAPVPSPPLAQLVPTNFTVQKVMRLPLDGSGIDNYAVTSVGSPFQNGRPEDLQVLRWDPLGSRWVIAFDAATALDQPTFVSGGPLESPAPFLPSDAHDDVISVLPAKLQPGRGEALVFNLSVAYNGPIGKVGVLEDSSGAFQLTYHADVSEGATVSLVGKAPVQRVRVTSQWITPVDAMCCPVHTYTQEIGYAQGTLGVLSDDRAWLGVTVVSLHQGQGGGDAHVLEVVQGSPAAGVLQPGDVLQDLNGQANPSTNLGPSFIEAVAKQTPGQTVTLDFIRAGHQMHAQVTLGSWATEDQAFVQDGLQPVSWGFLGASVQPSQTSTPGLYVASVVSNYPADQAGITSGDEIIALGRQPITSEDDLFMADYETPPGTQTTITYLDFQQGRHTVQVTMAVPPQGSQQIYSYPA